MQELITADGIDLAYREVLGRPADSEGMSHFLSLIEPYKLTLGRLMYILTESEEFKARDAGVRQKAMEAIRQRAHPAESVHWFHSIKLPDGYITNGVEPFGQDDIAELVFKYSVSGKTVLDIGAWDGYFSFAAEQRGAADVLATDWFCWDGPGWGTKAGFDFAHEALKSTVRSQSLDTFSLDPEIHGRFDVVVFLGVLYHLENPLGGLKRAAAMSSQHLVVSSATKNNDDPRPIMEYAEGHEGDATTFWLPNTSCVRAVLERLGFSRFEVLPSVSTPLGTLRHVIHAWRL